MLQVIVFALVLVAVFALKAAAVLVERDALVGKQAVFSWMAPRVVDVEAAQAAAIAVEEPVRAGRSRVAVRTPRVPA